MCVSMCFSCVFVFPGMNPVISLPALAKKLGGLYSLQLGERFVVVLADSEACNEVTQPIIIQATIANELRF